MMMPRWVLAKSGSGSGSSSSIPPPSVSKPSALECDLVLSSGFLAFANHSGFLRGVEESGARVRGVMGTSAGALTGSLFCAGYTAEDILRETTKDPPWKLVRPNLCFWKGLLRLDAVVHRLRELLPATFEELQTDFACAVLDAEGNYVLVDSGPLPEAVAASAAIPFLFARVDIPGRENEGPFADGGAMERVGLLPWRAREGCDASVLALCHVNSKSFGPLSGNDDLTGVPPSLNFEVVESPKSGVTLLSLGDWEGQYERAVKRTERAVREVCREREGKAKRPAA